MTPHLQCYGVSLESTGDDSTLSNASPTRPPRPVHHDHCLVRTSPQHNSTTPAFICSCTPSTRFTATLYTLRRPIPPLIRLARFLCCCLPLLVRFLGMTIHGMHSAENDSGAQFNFSRDDDRAALGIHLHGPNLLPLLSSATP